MLFNDRMTGCPPDGSTDCFADVEIFNGTAPPGASDSRTIRRDCDQPTLRCSSSVLRSRASSSRPARRRHCQDDGLSRRPPSRPAGRTANVMPGCPTLVAGPSGSCSWSTSTDSYSVWSSWQLSSAPRRLRAVKAMVRNACPWIRAARRPGNAAGRALHCAGEHGCALPQRRDLPVKHLVS